MRAVQPFLPEPRTQPWRAAQFAGVGLTVVLVVALLARPAAVLHVFWTYMIPVLPAAFLVNPLLWRNICPLATLNALSGDRFGTRRPGMRVVRGGWGLGIALLYALVPARRFIFNTNGVALAATLAALSLAALIAGMLFTRRSGFCDTWCPVLPVEKLYGQRPLMSLHTSRCSACTLCAPVGCIDLVGEKAVLHTIGPRRRDSTWLTTSFGVFAASFPGIVTAYFTLENLPLSRALEVYAHFGLLGSASYLIVLMLAVGLRLTSAACLRMLGAASFVLYYWFAARTLGDALAAPLVVTVVRLLAVALVTTWLSVRLTSSSSTTTRSAGVFKSSN